MFSVCKQQLETRALLRNSSTKSISRSAGSTICDTARKILQDHCTETAITMPKKRKKLSGKEERMAETARKEAKAATLKLDAQFPFKC